MVSGATFTGRAVKEAVNHGISMIYQELSPIKELSIAENVFTGRYPLTAARLMAERHYRVYWMEPSASLRKWQRNWSQ